MLDNLITDDTDITLVDMEAGLEHLSRSGGTLAYADVLVMVMEPSRKSVLTAARTAALADELGIPRTLAVGNKALPDDEQFFTDACAEHGIELAAIVPLDDAVTAADRNGISVTQVGADAARQAVVRLVDRLESLEATVA